MARIDAILSIARQQGANELRVGTDREPKMLASGAPKRLSIPATPEKTLRDLLGDILSKEREDDMRARGRIEFLYESSTLGPFHVSLVAIDGGGFEVIFLQAGQTQLAVARATRAADRSLCNRGSRLRARSS
jgi:twitching motility protein PilT